VLVIASSFTLAASDPLITLLVFVLFVGGSALMNWLKRRQQQAEAERQEVERARRTGRPVEEEAVSPEEVEWETAPAETQSQPAPKARSWEEELKRLLEGDFANPPPSSRPEPPPLPPVVIVPPQRPMPRPQPARVEPVSALPSLPPIFSREGQTEDSPAHDTHEGSEHLATLSESSSGFARASHLSETVAAKMASRNSQSALLTPETSAMHRRVRSAEMASVLRLLRTPTAARQVIIAQTVLGTPKGLET
jgi:hypothetical protein